MRRRALALGILVLAAAPALRAQPIGSLDNLHTQTTISESDREQVRAWLRPLIADLVAVGDPELRRMTRARRAIVAEGRPDPNLSPAFLQAYGEEAVASLRAALRQAISQEARVNILMTLIELRRPAAVPVFLKVLQDDPYPATRYVAAKGLSTLAPVIVERVMPRVETAIAQGLENPLRKETDGLLLYHLFETLGRFDAEQAHDVLAVGVGRAAMRLDASKPTGAWALGAAVRALEEAYTTEVRPDAKRRLLMAYAMLCAWIMPPTADSGLMTALNASLEQITTDRVGFAAGLDQDTQKLALMEWIEKLVRDERIPARPMLPPAIQQAAEKALKKAG